jgi:hypothetical protein
MRKAFISFCSIFQAKKKGKLGIILNEDGIPVNVAANLR